MRVQWQARGRAERAMGREESRGQRVWGRENEERWRRPMAVGGAVEDAGSGTNLLADAVISCLGLASERASGRQLSGLEEQ